MSTKELAKAVRRLRELEAEAAQLGGEIDALKEQIKAEMAVRDVDEMQAGVFRVRWTAVQSTRLDSAAFQGLVCYSESFLFLSLSIVSEIALPMKLFTLSLWLAACCLISSLLPFGNAIEILSRCAASQFLLLCFTPSVYLRADIYTPPPVYKIVSEFSTLNK